MKNAEYQGSLSCPQRDSAEHKGYAGAQSVGSQEGKEQGGADLLERILSRENLNRACKRVKANKGAPGIDGMTVEQALPWLREHREELLETMEETQDESKEPLYEQNHEEEIDDSESKIAAKIDLERLFDLMSNKRYVMVIRELVLKEVEPEFLALSMGITVANLYNIKKRALAALAHLAMNDKKKYENKR